MGRSQARDAHHGPRRSAKNRTEGEPSAVDAASSRTCHADLVKPILGSTWSSFGWVGLLAFYPLAALATDAAQVEKGAAVYALRCASCHGEGLRNVSGGWSFDLRRLRPDEHDRFVDSVTTGKDNMPSWYGILKDDEIEALWSYIRATVDQ
jgi:mono/diheme cytochrome c family protein